MKRYVILFIILLAAGAVGDCPFCHGGIIKYCNVDIHPEPPMYGRGITINVSTAYMMHFEPVKEGTKVEILYYNASRNLTTVKLETDKDGIVRFIPNMVGYHLVRACGRAMLIYVNTTCGDGVCGGGETREDCAEDCGTCGDGVCDSNEGPECPDCAVCGDGACTAGESRSTCLKDCAVCGDGICDYTENRGSCRDDCESGEPDDFCDGEDDGVCDPDCEVGGDPDCVAEEPAQETPTLSGGEGSSDNSWPIAAAIFLIACGIAFLILRKRGIWQKKKPRPESGTPGRDTADSQSGKPGKMPRK